MRQQLHVRMVHSTGIPGIARVSSTSGWFLRTVGYTRDESRCGGRVLAIESNKN